MKITVEPYDGRYVVRCVGVYLGVAIDDSAQANMIADWLRTTTAEQLLESVLRWIKGERE